MRVAKQRVYCGSANFHLTLSEVWTRSIILTESYAAWATQSINQLVGEKMNKRLIYWVVTCCACVFLSGCFGSVRTKPPVEKKESTHGVVIKFDEKGHMVLVNDEGVPYVPCGEDQRVPCPKISKETKKDLIGNVYEVKAIHSQDAKKSSGKASDCEYVIIIEIDGKKVYLVIDLCTGKVK